MNKNTTIILIIIIIAVLGLVVLIGMKKRSRANDYRMMQNTNETSGIDTYKNDSKPKYDNAKPTDNFTKDNSGMSLDDIDLDSLDDSFSDIQE